MNVIKFPISESLMVTEEYLLENRQLFEKHGYDLKAIRSEAELVKALEAISSAEWSSVAERMEEAAKDPGRPAEERKFWSEVTQPSRCKP